MQYIIMVKIKWVELVVVVARSNSVLSFSLAEGNLAKESISRHVTEIENLNLRVITLEHDLKSYQSGVDPEKARLKQEVESLKQQMLGMFVQEHVTKGALGLCVGIKTIKIIIPSTCSICKGYGS